MSNRLQSDDLKHLENRREIDFPTVRRRMYLESRLISSRFSLPAQLAKISVSAKGTSFTGNTQ